MTFWHIPWPNPEAFGICPWAGRDPRRPARQQHSRVPHPVSTATTSSTPSTASSKRASIASRSPVIFAQGMRTLVQRYPISIEWPPSALQGLAVRRGMRAMRCASALASRRTLRLGVGVERFDYTKGILERFLRTRAPARVGTRSGWRPLHFCRVGAPTRSKLANYQRFQLEDVRDGATRINERFGRRGYAAHHAASSDTTSPTKSIELLPRGRRLLRQQPARRHEPRRQGIRRRAR